MADVSCGAMAEGVTHRRCPTFISGHIVRDLRWTECGTGSIWFRVFSFSHSLSFCQCNHRFFLRPFASKPLVNLHNLLICVFFGLTPLDWLRFLTLTPSLFVIVMSFILRQLVQKCN